MSTWLLKLRSSGFQGLGLGFRVFRTVKVTLPTPHGRTGKVNLRTPHNRTAAKVNLIAGPRTAEVAMLTAPKFDKPSLFSVLYRAIEDFRMQSFRAWGHVVPRGLQHVPQADDLRQTFAHLHDIHHLHDGLQGLWHGSGMG